jgi:hypothetical protein
VRVEGGHHCYQFLHLQVPHQGPDLQHPSYQPLLYGLGRRAPEYGDLPAIRALQTEQHVYGRRLAGAIWAQEGDGLAPGDNNVPPCTAFTAPKDFLSPAIAIHPSAPTSRTTSGTTCNAPTTKLPFWLGSPYLGLGLRCWRCHPATNVLLAHLATDETRSKISRSGFNNPISCDRNRTSNGWSSPQLHRRPAGPATGSLALDQLPQARAGLNFAGSDVDVSTSSLGRGGGTALRMGSISARCGARTPMW